MNAYTSQQLIMLNQNSIEEQKRMSLSKPRLKTPHLNLNQSKSLGIIKLEASGPSENNGLDQIYEDGRDGTYRMQQADQANQINQNAIRDSVQSLQSAQQNLSNSQFKPSHF